MNKHHPANNVTPKGDYLKNKNVWLAVTGSVSCVESVGIARELLRYGANVTSTSFFGISRRKVIFWNSRLF